MVPDEASGRVFCLVARMCRLYSRWKSQLSRGTAFLLRARYLLTIVNRSHFTSHSVFSSLNDFCTFSATLLAFSRLQQVCCIQSGLLRFLGAHLTFCNPRYLGKNFGLINMRLKLFQT